MLEELVRRPLCGDGAMGTLLMAKGLAGGSCGMAWNLDRPGDVRDIHSSYRAAGSDLITTNSFGGSRFVLAMHGRAEQVRELNLAAARVAREAAGDSAWVLGDVGPCGDFLEPVGDLTSDEVRDGFQIQIAALVEGGVDAVLIETMSDPAEVVAAIQAAREVSASIPVLATYAFQKTQNGEFRTMMGSTIADAIGRAVDAGANVVGANCGAALDLPDYVALCKEIAAAAGRAKVMIQPNAGAPQQVNGHTLYLATPEDMATTAIELLQAGAAMVGGCCGTTPGHLAAIAAALRGR